MGGLESATCHEHRTAPSCSIQGRKFFNKLNDHHLLCDCAAWNYLYICNTNVMANQTFEEEDISAPFNLGYQNVEC